jgi:CRISPR-associated protein Cas6
VPFVDLAFRLTVPTIPVDHGYALYSAVSRFLPGLHTDKEIGIHPIRGRYVGDGGLHLTSSSRLTIRLPDDRIRDVLKLAGKRLELDGYQLQVGIPEVGALRASAALYSRLATIKWFMEVEPTRRCEAAARVEGRGCRARSGRAAHAARQGQTSGRFRGRGYSAQCGRLTAPSRGRARWAPPHGPAAPAGGGVRGWGRDGLMAWGRGAGASARRALMSTSRWKIRVGSRTVASAPG